MLLEAILVLGDFYHFWQWVNLGPKEPGRIGLCVQGVFRLRTT